MPGVDLGQEIRLGPAGSGLPVHGAAVQQPASSLAGPAAGSNY